MTHRLHDEENQRSYTEFTNRSNVKHLNEDVWRIKHESVMTVFLKYRGYKIKKGELKKYSVERSKEKIIKTIGHETGHIIGLGDAYDRSKEVDTDGTIQYPDRVGFTKTDEI